MRRTSVIRLLLLLPVCSAGFVPAAVAQASDGAWDRADERAVAHAGVLPSLSDGFHGERALSGVELRAGLAALSARGGSRATAVSPGAVTVAGFDRALVAELGLGDVASAVQAEARRAGLAPPERFGSEVVARMLALRFNHPASDDRLELYPTDAITRAEAAFSFARVLAFSGWEVANVRSALGSFSLPRYSAVQRRALTLAVSKIGMPYVWGGESDTTQGVYGAQAHGGYDCSGFIWRVFKLSGNPAGARIGGRTAAQMAGEIPRSQRLAFGHFGPADLLFFGPAGFNGRATESGIIHAAIALSPQWAIHSSDQGVYVEPIADWLRSSFAWGRHVL